MSNPIKKNCKIKRERHETMTEADAIEAVKKFAAKASRYIQTTDTKMFESYGEGEEKPGKFDQAVMILFPREEPSTLPGSFIPNMEGMRKTMEDLEIIGNFYEAMKILGGQMLPKKG